MNMTSTMLKVEGVSVRFGGLQALSEVGFDIRQGEILGLIGPNGAGKSTLLNVISGFVRPDRGSVHFDGELLTGRPPEFVNRAGLVRTFQAAEVLAGMTVVENVMAAGVARLGEGVAGGLARFVRAGQSMAALYRMACEKLELVGLAALADQPAQMLTAGQQRLLAAARALGTEARLLILDEPAAGLTNDEKMMLAAAIRRIRAAGVTVMFVEHDLAFVSSLAERLVVLDHGTVIAKGETRAVSRDPQVLAAYLGETDLVVARGRAGAAASAAPLLKLERVAVRYGALHALGGIDLEVRAGEIVTLIGANGAGKSSTLKAISGLCKLAGGAIVFDGKPLHGLAAERRIAAGIALAPEGRQLFPMLTVRDNLMIGRFSHIRAAGFGNLFRPGAAAAREVEAAMREVLDFFPRLAERIDQQAGTLSGGEGQMVAIGRALMSRPKLLMLDEPSFGLAPRVTREILELLPRLAERGIAVLLVEQNAHAALQVADRGYVLANGAIVAHGSGEELLQSSHVGEAYLGWQHEDETAEVAA